MTVVRSVLLGKGRKKIDNVVVYRRLGKTVFRSRPPEHYKNWKHPSEKQLLQENRFKACLILMQAFNRTVRLGFKHEVKPGQTPFNVAMGWNKKNAITNTEPAEVQYANMLLAKGTLMTALVDSHSSSKTTQQVSLTWIDNSGQGNALASDILCAAIWNKTTSQQVEVTPTTAKRSDGTAAIQCPGSFMSIGDKIEIYSFFVSADGKINSTSVYWGEDSIA